jgi:hypothetical protein
MTTRTTAPSRGLGQGTATVGTSRAVLAAMYAGLALTVVATVVPWVDRATSDTLADHIQASYPAYGPGRIDTAVTTYLVYLSAVGALGIAGWLVSIRGIRRATWWARGAATGLFAVGTAVALTDLLIRDTSGDTGLAPLIGWVGVLPCLPGLLAVTVLWRKP